MNKILACCLVLLLLSAAAGAQRTLAARNTNRAQMIRIERIQMHRDQLRLKLFERNARRDGIITPMERKRIIRAKRKNRVHRYRFRYN
jgi:hypothetical protein